jgi:hypothetical protein
MALCAQRASSARVTIRLRGGRWCTVCESELPGGEQPRQLGIDAGEAMLGVGDGVAGGGAQGRRGGEGALGVLGRGEVVAVL